jgi:hypothetical protein
VLLEYGLVVADAGEQVPLREPAAALAREKRGRGALCLAPNAVGAGKLAVALDLALLAQLASEHPLGLRPDTDGVERGRLVAVRHGQPSSV